LKNFTLLLLAVFSILVFNVNAKAQSQPSQRNCATDDVMQQLFQNDPAARARYENTQRQFESRIRAIMNNPQNRTQAIVTIPVVVHVGVTAPRQALVTNAIIQSQIDTLNFYYGAQPIGDSLRVYTPFRTTYGRSEIRFCMAQRTPANAPSTGIVRTVTSSVFSTSNHPSTELGAWDPTKYLNVWVVELTGGVLGYAYLPGSFTPSDPRNGFVNDFRAFGAGPGTGSGGYHYNEYNLGKTAVHEIGHYFNLLHPWGSGGSNPTCTGTDNCADTPPTAGPTFGCPSSPVTNTCAPADPGVQFQNHMDYADDACMYLFTVNQCSRMTTSLTLADRIGLTTSNGCQPIITTNDDAQVSAILDPSSASSTACATVPLRVTLRNNGTNAITTANIRVRVNGADVPAAAFNFAGNLAPAASTTVTMPNLNLAALGAYTIQVHSTIPNGVPDSSPANDTSTVSITRVGTAALPVVENFEGASFPSAGWQNRNPDAPGIGWARATVLSPAGTRAAFFDYYNYATNNAKDSLISPDIDMTNPPGLKLLQFDRAYASYEYPPFPSAEDTLEIMVSTNCGASYTTVWKKFAALVSNPNSLNTTTLNTTSLYVPGTLSDYVTETVDITSVIGASPVGRVLFKTINRFGNSLFLDNINISSQFQRDMGVTVITNPLANECNNTITPQVTVRNLGTEVLNSYTVEYTVDGANTVSATFNTPIAPGATAVVSLPVSGVIAAGNHVFRAYTINPVGPSGTGDQNTTNDAQTRNFTVRNVTNAPAIETFEGAAFPSPNWSIANPNNNTTWVKRNQGYLSYNSAFMDNYNTAGFNQVDDILTPVFRTTGNGGAQADSVIITWDLAARYYPATPYDTFTVRTSPDCGNTFPNTLFNAGGTTLGAGDFGDFTVPIESEWRNRRVAIGGAAITSGTHMVGFRNKNQFGNNMFVDNINVSLLFKRDIGVVAINNPDAECSATFTPNVTVRNFGSETVTAFSVSYRINNGTIQTANFTQSLARNAQANVSLPANSGTLATGSHTITAFTLNPVTTSGTGDQFQANDTLTRSFAMLGSLPAPLIQTFESAIFPPANWGVFNPNGDLTWQRNVAGNNNAGSAYMSNWNNLGGRGQLDYLYSPNVTYTGVDSISLSFDISAVTKLYPGSQQLPLDTVEVFVTNNCGTTFTSIYKKWGADLQTVGNPNDPQPFEFFPVGSSHWRNEKIDLTAFAPNGPLQVVFRNRNGFGNNVFIDNVNLKTRTLPASLKSDGIQILPSPFQTTFQIWHLQQPTTLKSVRVFNSAGQLVWQKEYSLTAPKIIDVDLSRNAAGVYVVELRYSTRGTDQQIRIIKTQ
jgi:Pregnancy-associated plasma protein-A